VKPLDHRTYLKGKPGGENSMFGKARHDQTAYSCARQGPDGMVKADCLNPNTQSVKFTGQIQRESSDVLYERRPVQAVFTHAPGDKAVSNGHKGMKWAPNPS
jgi:hypothetical protein